MHPAHTDPRPPEHVATSYPGGLYVTRLGGPSRLLTNPAEQTGEALDAALAADGWERTSSWHTTYPGAPWSADVQRAPEQPQVPTVREVNAARDRVRAYLDGCTDVDADNEIDASWGGSGDGKPWPLLRSDLRAITSDTLR